MALRDGPGPRVVLKGKRDRRERVISACEKLPHQLTLAKARELGSFLYDGLIQQLRSIGPGLVVDRWIREHCPDLQEPQAQVIESQITWRPVGLRRRSRCCAPGCSWSPTTSRASTPRHGLQRPDGAQGGA